MNKQAWLTQGIPLLVAAAAPVGSAGAQTLSSRGRTQAPLVVRQQEQHQAQQHLDLASFGAFTNVVLEAPKPQVETPVATARPVLSLKSLAPQQLEKLLQKNTQSGTSDKLFSGVQAVGGTEELIRTVGVCISHSYCSSNSFRGCFAPADCGTSQTITFNNPGAKNFGTSPTLTATASSGLTVTFSSATTGVCTITGGGTLTFVTAGTCTIRANQAGNGTYNAASQVQQSFTVNAVVPGAPTIGTATAGNTQVSVTFSAPGSNGGASITGYTVTSSPGGITGTGASSPITVTGLTNGTAYTFSVTATNSAGTGSASAASNSATPIAPQTITFANPGAQNFGTTPTLTATATSGLTPTFTSSTTGVCTITSGGALTFVTAGTCTINADQAGNSSFSAASQVSRSFTVNAVVPGAPTVGTATAGNTQASVTFSAPGSNGGTSITGYVVTASPGGATGTGASSPITVTGLSNGTAYTFTVTATNSVGTGSASAASNSITPVASQTITFANPGAQNFGTTPTLTATADSGLTPTFTSSTTGVCTITSGGALTFVTAGTCTINADQAGNASFSAASQVSRSFTVNAVVPGAPSVGTATAGDTQATVTFSAPGNTGGASITGYTATSNPGGLTGTSASSPITVTGLTNGVAYTFTVTATNSAGTGSASAASNSITPAANQTITFANPGAQNFGTTPTLTATATSGLTPSFTSSTTGVCTITSGGALTFVTTGTCTINANQAGNSSFLAASQVSRSFTVNAVVPGAPTIGVATAGDTQASVAFSAPAFTGGGSITGYTVTSNPGGLTGTGGSSPVVITGLTNGIAYTFTVTADNTAGTGSASAASNSITPAATQTITFATPGAQNFGTTPTLTATSDSGLTPSFTSSTTGVCTITSGGALTFVTAGTCTINADQAGNSSYLAASQVSRSFTVNAIVPGAPTIGAATAGNTQANVAFSAPASTGGASITGYTVTANPGGATGTGASSPISVTGLSNGTSYTFTVTATNSAGTGSASAASNSVTPVAPQSISFANPGAKNLGSSNTLSATASSGLTPTFTSATPAVCTITSSGVLTLVTTGTCTINADQSGSSNYSAASTVSQSFTINPKPNTAPVITQGSSVSVTMSEDSSPNAFLVAISAIDAENNTLTWSLQTQALHGVATVSGTGASPTISYLPTADYHGSDSFVVQVNDGTVSSIIRVDVAITPVNDAPLISGNPTLSIDQDLAYSFVPAASDIDGDTLTFSITNKPTWASFNTATGALSGTPALADAGIAHGIVISVSDGALSASLPAFDLEVVRTIDPKMPILTVPAELQLDATGLFTPLSIAQLLGLSANATQAEIDAALKGLANDSTHSDACCTTKIEGLNANNQLLLAPGHHEITWTATSTSGLSATGTQVVNLRPLVSLSKSQVAIRGSEVQVRVILNGPSPVYPLDIPVAIDPATTAASSEYSFSNTIAHFTTAGQTEAVLPVTVPNLITGDSQLILGLTDANINKGAASSHTINLRTGNVAPTVTMHLSQGGVNTTLIVPNGGPVTATAEVSDPNVGDTHTFDWSATETALVDTDGNTTNAERVFNPAGLTGSHQLQVTVTDSAGATASAQLYFLMSPTLPVLSPIVDTDKDGIDDLIEGIGDTNSNGIPDYLDNMPTSNILPQTIAVSDAYLLECDPGVSCGLGLFALSGTSGGVQITTDELNTIRGLSTDSQFTPVGGIFDFAIRDLPTPGQSVRVVIPQRTPIPAKAVYRKYHRGAWMNFVENANNSVHSALGTPGYCPPPGASDWTSGLKQGDLCVQLTIQDGGANDDDGLINGAVIDPGVVSVPQAVEQPKHKKKGGGISELWLLVLGGLLLLKRKKSSK